MTNVRAPQVGLFGGILPVYDNDTAARFYTHVLGAARQRVWLGRHYIHCGPTILALYDSMTGGDAVDRH
jgi:hypothetical protein